MKFVNLRNSFLVVSFVSLSAFAQKPTPTPKIKQVPKTLAKTVQKTPDISAADSAKAAEFVKQGKAFWKEFEIRPAIDSFTKAIEINPNHLEALTERGVIYFLINEDKNAASDLDRVLKIEPNNLKALHFRGLALTDIAIDTKDELNDRNTAGDIAQKALADFNKAIDLEPNNLNYYNGRGKLILAFGFYKEAVSDFEKSISIEPNEMAYTQLGLAKYYLDDKSAIGEINKAIKLAPTFAEAYYTRATINRDEGRYKEAILDFDEAIKHNQYNAKYYNTRGMLYFRLQDGYQAVADFTRAIKEKNDYAMPYFNRAMTYKRLPYSVSDNDDDDAIDKIRLQRQKMLEDLDSAIRYKTNFDAAYVERGLINSTDMRNKLTPDAETISRLKFALADFENAIKYNPKNAEAYNGRASCHDRLGKKDAALADYTKAIQLDPTLATAYMGRMAIYCEMGKKELSIADEKKVKELGFAAFNACSF
ncbi:MAG: tetratricopeptide repeat protein [Pyrinomonadaceae bacterium]|nr:tetratricopeptide repeat protein [Pyrinomonadaceae bacterium]